MGVIVIAVVKNLVVRAGADFSGMRREVLKSQKTLTDFKKSTSRIMGGIAAILVSVGIGKIVSDTAEAYDYQIEQETKLAVVMKQRMHATQDMINQVKSLASAQQALGIVGDEVQLAGAQQLATFLNLSGSLKTLLPAMNNLISQQKGVKATGEDAVNIANMMGKVFTGQTGALRRVGISFSEAQEKVLKYGNESEKAAMLAQIITENVGEMNAALANTPQGRWKQIQNQFGDLKEEIGKAVIPLRDLLVPALKNLINLATVAAIRLQQALSFVAQFTNALFGKNPAKDISAVTSGVGDTADSVDGLGDSYEQAGKEAKGALAGFDEINSITDSAGGSGADSGIDSIIPALGAGDPETNDAQSSKIKEMADKVRTQMDSIKDTITQNKQLITSALGGILAAFVAFKAIPFFASLPAVFAGIGTAVSGLLAPVAIAAAVIGSLVAAFLYLYQTNQKFRDQINAVWSDIAKTLKDFHENTLKPIGDYFINDFAKPIVHAVKNSILPVLADMFIGASLILKDLLKLVISIFESVWQTIKPAMDLIKNIIVDVLKIVKDVWDKHGIDIINNVRNLIKGLQDTFMLIWTNVIDPIIQPALEMLTELWEKHLSGLVAQVGEFIVKLVKGALEIYNGFIKPLIDWFILHLGPTISTVISAAINVFGMFLGSVSDIVKGVFKVLGGLIDFIVGVFTGDWQKAWEGVKTIFSGIFDTFGVIVKGALNLVIDAINGMLRLAVKGLNDFIQGAVALANRLPNMNLSVGLINAPEIPRLAQGGITNGEMIATIGDNPGGREVVSPLDDLKDIIASVVSAAMQFSGNQGSQQGVINLYMDSTLVARAISPSLEKEKLRTGKMVIVQA